LDHPITRSRAITRFSHPLPLLKQLTIRFRRPFWNPDGKHCAARPVVIAPPYEALVPVNNVFGKPQAKSGPGVPLGSEKWLEKLVTCSLGNAGAVVHHGNPHSGY
jgi:hypothetical protein